MSEQYVGSKRGRKGWKEDRGEKASHERAKESLSSPPLPVFPKESATEREALPTTQGKKRNAEEKTKDKRKWRAFSCRASENFLPISQK